MLAGSAVAGTAVACGVGPGDRDVAQPVRRSAPTRAVARGASEVAIGLLIVAAEDGKRDKAQAATEAIERVLRDRRFDPVLVDEPAEHLG